ncbi:PhzF family phenazine biosynthesis protein [Tunturiibacter psychrotolerans]|uniref:PhzF family phenazine biosynthesis protein n=1 Tax=Tunturiibacter psychrotolerans TaxID=3069686 RepID=UPI00333EB06C
MLSLPGTGGFDGSSPSARPRNRSGDRCRGQPRLKTTQTHTPSSRWRGVLPVLSGCLGVTVFNCPCWIFNPSQGVVEEAATSTAAVPLACLLLKYGIAANRKTLFIEQGYEMKRPCVLEVEVENDVLRLAGRAITRFENELREVRSILTRSLAWTVTLPSARAELTSSSADTIGRCSSQASAPWPQASR